MAWKLAPVISHSLMAGDTAETAGDVRPPPETHARRGCIYDSEACHGMH